MWEEKSKVLIVNRLDYFKKETSSLDYEVQIYHIIFKYFLFSLNDIGKKKITKKGNKKKGPDFDKIFEKKPAKKVFKDLANLPVLSEFEKSALKIYKPSFTKQKLDYRKTKIPSLGRSHPMKARILYGEEADINEYPWQISMWIDQSHFCGGTLVTDQWVVTAAHCVDLQYK